MSLDGKRIYMAGAGGMLGEGFHDVLAGRCEIRATDIDVNANWLSPLDFRDFDAYRNEVVDFRPDYLFHLGALTSLEYCEEHPDEAYATNTLGVEHAVHIANALDVPLLYISTAGIFDGAKDSYDDWDQPNPLGHYARSKYMGERFVAENARRFLVCRAGWMMGGGPAKDKKFIQKLMMQLKAGASELHVVDDKLGTPTYTRDFARNAELLLGRGFWGVYNLVCSGVTSRLEVARYLVDRLGLAERVRITPVSSDYFAAEYFAARPASERLLTTKLDLRGLNVMRDWRVCLDDYLADRYADFVDGPAC
ncbi:MAG TPA: sugar nucleotide-binding protein [Sphingomicrobium sp.]|nr:sugar nucleotide-binding protein [Sphingomicrobium sp.]